MLLGRFVARAQACFDPYEGLVGCVLGREEGGRRRVAIVASERRVLVVTLRPEPPIELSYDGLAVELTVASNLGCVRLASGGRSFAVDRIEDVDRAALLVSMLARRAAGSSPERTAVSSVVIRAVPEAGDLAV